MASELTVVMVNDWTSLTGKCHPERDRQPQGCDPRAVPVEMGGGGLDPGLTLHPCYWVSCQEFLPTDRINICDDSRSVLGLTALLEGWVGLKDGQNVEMDKFFCTLPGVICGRLSGILGNCSAID